MVSTSHELPEPHTTPSLRRQGRMLLATLLSLVIFVHVAGRAAAFCAPVHSDSLLYALAAYRFWQPDVNFTDIIPDKPVGQALLTGWTFELWPPPPTRLALIPVESLFMLGAYATLYLLTRRCFGRRAAAVLTLLYALAFNTYNVVDYTTDGFNLNENYMALPLLLAATIHLTGPSPLARPLATGAMLGAAVLIKQTALGLLAVVVLHTLWRGWTRREDRTLPRILLVALGACLVLAPVACLLLARGWLLPHLADLLQRTPPHIAATAFQLPEKAKLMPLAPIAWWGLAALAAMQRRQFPPCTANARQLADSNDVALFAGFWLLTECLIVASLTIPAAHYYQSLAAPACLCAGFAMATLRDNLARLPLRPRTAAWRWICAIGAALGLAASLPMLHLASVRLASYTTSHEVSEFRQAIDEDLLAVTAQQIRGRQHAPR